MLPSVFQTISNAKEKRQILAIQKIKHPSHEDMGQGL
jgi:hypothetical protein